MAKSCLNYSEKEKLSNQLIVEVYRFIEKHIQSEDPRLIFLSGNCAALFHLRKLSNQTSAPVNENLICFLRSEYQKFISFGVRDHWVFQKIAALLKEGTELGNDFIITGLNRNRRRQNRLSLDSRINSVEITSKAENQTLTVKFYENSQFQTPAFDATLEFCFNNTSLKLHARAVKESIGPQAEIAVLSLIDLMLLKYFSTLAPVTQKVHKHNQMILAELQRLLLEQSSPNVLAYCFKTFQSFIEPRIINNHRLALLSKLGFTTSQIEHLRNSYHFVADLFNEPHGKKNTYHNIWHTDYVLTYTIEFFNKFFPDYPYMEELCIAAIFHDCNLGLEKSRLGESVLKHLLQNQVTLSKSDTHHFLEQIKHAASPEDEAGQIARVFCIGACGFHTDQADMVSDFIAYTQLGHHLIPPANQESETKNIGRAIIQMADIYQVTLGDFSLFLKNNWHLMYELNGEPQQWFKNTTDMLNQLTSSLEENCFTHPLFNLNLLQFDFPGKQEFKKQLLEGLCSNHEHWLKHGLGKCIEWGKEIASMKKRQVDQAEG